MSRRSVLTGSLEIRKRGDSTGGDLYVEGTLQVNRNGEAVDILSLASSITTYRHEQTSPNSVWTVSHSLNTSTPFVKIFVGGREVLSRVAYETATPTQVEIHFVTPCVGEAILLKI